MKNIIVVDGLRRDAKSRVAESLFNRLVSKYEVVTNSGYFDTYDVLCAEEEAVGNDAIPEEFIDVVEADLTEGGCTTVDRGDTRDGGRFFFCIGKIGDRVMIRLERNMLEYAFNDDVKYNLAFLNA